MLDDEKGKIILEISKVINSNDFISSKKTKEFEELVVERFGCKYAYACANGTDALLLALRCFDLKKDEYVIVPDYTFISTSEVVNLCGAIPLFVDIDPLTFNINPSHLKKILKKSLETGLKIRGVISVDLFGSLCDYKHISKICKQNNLFYISDSAQSFGIKFNGKATTYYADVVCSSFYPTKPLGAFGDAGICLTNNKKHYDRIKSLANHGSKKTKYLHYEIGYSSRIDEIQSVVLLYKYKMLFDNAINQRKKVWHDCQLALNEYGFSQLILFDSSYYCFTFIPNNLDCKSTALKIVKERFPFITLLTNYIPLHKMPIYKTLIAYDSFRNTNNLSKRLLAFLIAI